MKKLLSFLILMMICPILPSCSDDKEKDEQENSLSNKNELLLPGEWRRKESYSNTNYYHLVFREGGIGYDKVISPYDSSYNVDETFNWSVKGDNLTIYWEGGDVQSVTIINLTAKELIVKNGYPQNDFTYYTRVD